MDDKVGGDIAWPKNEVWPVCLEHPDTRLSVVLQIHQDSFDEVTFPPGADIMQMLWCHRSHRSTGAGPLPVVYWRNAGSLDSSHTSRSLCADSESMVGGSSHLCSVSPERVVEFPSAFSLGLGDDDLEAFDSWIACHAADELRSLDIKQKDDLYQYHFSSAPGTKIAGYPNWVREENEPQCDCGSMMQLLVTIADIEFSGEYQRWMPIEERYLWQEDWVERKRVQSPLGLNLEGASVVFVFICMECRHWPVRAISQ